MKPLVLVFLAALGLSASDVAKPDDRLPCPCYGQRLPPPCQPGHPPVCAFMGVDWRLVVGLW